MPHNKIPVLLILLLFSLPGLAQISKGDKHFERSEYTKAIPFYRKASRQDDLSSRKEALVKLGDTYRRVNDYAKAELAYQQAIETEGETAPQVHYNYAQVLKVNNKYEEAVEQYKHYIRLAPDDENARNALKFCQEIKYYMSKPREYTVKNVAAVNTPLSEFAPFVSQNKLMFVAEREQLDFVNYPVSANDGRPFLNMYVSELDGADLKKPKSFSRRLNTEFHDGPGSTSSDGQTLYFTRVSKGKRSTVNRAKIYIATRSDKKWGDIQLLPLTADEYSAAHPAISSDNNSLFFTSDMPGGYGGKDLWMCSRSGSGWSNPVNLGPDINTAGDEMFPSVRADGVLFFTSNGLPGFGGLDLYSARKTGGKWLLERNEGLDINSSADDFGITFLNDTLGYFSSNRVGGKGSDDIYLFEFSSKNMIVSGTVLLTENSRSYAKGKKVILFDDKQMAVDSTVTNSKGFFIFRNLDSEKRYMAVLAENDPELFGKARYYLAENDSVIHRVSSRVAANRFAFKNLPINTNELPDLYTDDDLVFAGSLMTGAKGTIALKNAKLKIVNDFGDVMEETTTNEFGAFAFRKIPTDQNYLITIEETDIALPPGTKITLTNRSGKTIKTFYKPAKGKFTFKVLQSDKKTLSEMDAEDVNLVMGIYGFMYDQDKRPIVNAKIRVKKEDGTEAQDLVTSDKGKFHFKNLSADKNYIFEADESDVSLSGVRRIYIADSKGRIYKVIDIVGGKFSFKILEPDKSALGEFVVDDPWLKVAQQDADKKKKEPAAVNTVTTAVKEDAEDRKSDESEVALVIVENIYYAYGDYKLGPDGERILNKAVEALKEYPKLVMDIYSHTDSRSTTQFNMTLSQKRAQACVDYLVKHGVSRSRLKAKGYGESRLLNNCGDNVECTEEQHAQNRRTEFRITKPIKQ